MPGTCGLAACGYHRTMRRLHEELREIRVPSEQLARWALETPVALQEATAAALAFLVHAEHAAATLLPVPTLLRSEQAILDPDGFLRQPRGAVEHFRLRAHRAIAWMDLFIFFRERLPADSRDAWKRRSRNCRPPRCCNPYCGSWPGLPTHSVRPPESWLSALVPRRYGPAGDRISTCWRRPPPSGRGVRRRATRWSGAAEAAGAYAGIVTPPRFEVTSRKRNKRWAIVVEAATAEVCLDRVERCRAPTTDRCPAAGFGGIGRAGFGHGAAGEGGQGGPRGGHRLRLRAVRCFRPFDPRRRALRDAAEARRLGSAHFDERPGDRGRNAQRRAPLPGHARRLGRAGDAGLPAPRRPRGGRAGVVPARQ